MDVFVKQFDRKKNMVGNVWPGYFFFFFFFFIFDSPIDWSFSAETPFFLIFFTQKPPNIGFSK